MQAIVWQDHFLKERNARVPMMRRSSRNMEYYLRNSRGGCFVAEERGKIVGSIISHIWGDVGWFGPLEVLPAWQGKGVGKALVRKSVEFLGSKGCGTIGCETMAGSAYNIAFYNKLGFRSRGLSNVLYKRLGEVPPEELEGGSAFENPPASECRPLWKSVHPGLDYGMELELAAGMGLGKVFGISSGGATAHAITHTYEMFDGSQNAIIKLLVAGKSDLRTAADLLDACELAAAVEGKTGMFLRTYDPSPPELVWFLARGYSLQGTSVRFLLQGRDESSDAIHVSSWSG